MDHQVGKKFRVLCEIVRAQHFAWREAAVEAAPGVDPLTIVKRMWEVTGVQTARSYLKRLEAGPNLPMQVAESIAWSSDSMGEDAVVEAGSNPSEAYVRHTACPWFRWHKQQGLLEEDQPGCDEWFRSMLQEIDGTLDTKLRFETLQSLPEGGPSCLRRIWLES